MTVSIIYIDPQTVVAVGVILGKVAIDVILIFVQAMWIQMYPC